MLINLFAKICYDCRNLLFLKLVPNNAIYLYLNLLSCNVGRCNNKRFKIFQKMLHWMKKGILYLINNQLTIKKQTPQEFPFRFFFEF